MKNIVATISFMFISFVGNTQVLFTENFENYTLGNLFTTAQDNTIPGQGGWYLSSRHTGGAMVNAYKITQEPNKGKVLTLTTISIPTEKIALNLVKQGLDAFINQRTIGNNILKLEVDYYTGEQQNKLGIQVIRQSFILSYENKGISLYNDLFRINYYSDLGELNITYNIGNNSSNHVRFNTSNPGMINLPYNTWVKIIVYLDYNNGKIYGEIPYANIIGVGDQFLANSTSTNLFEDFKPTEISMFFGVSDKGRNVPLTNKYDNIKITALKEVPPHILSAESFLAQKFNMYPNPATHVVNITNNENMLVNQVAIYDTAGKLINTQSFNEQAELQLNVEHLASGTYMLHLKTAEGIAVKKLVKK